MEGRDFPFSHTDGCVVVTCYVQAQIICIFLLDAVVHEQKNCTLVGLVLNLYSL